MIAMVGIDLCFLFIGLHSDRRTVERSSEEEAGAIENPSSGESEAKNIVISSPKQTERIRDALTVKNVTLCLFADPSQDKLYA